MLMESQAREVQRLANYLTLVVNCQPASERETMEGMEFGGVVPADKVIEEVVRISGKSARQVSMDMGRNDKYLYITKGRGSDIRVSTLVDLVDGAGVNCYFEKDGIFYRLVPSEDHAD